MPTLSLCMIARDEADRLAAALTAARPAVDELVVVDTGSSDATIAVARQHGARVERFPWCDDFAAARNASLAAATGDWALVLDADEVLARPTQARAALLAFAQNHEGRLGQVTIENRADDRVQSTVSIARFLPLGRGILYRGRIHETLARSGATGLPAAPTGVTVQHFGYDEALVAQRAKLERNVRLCQRALADDPTDGYVAWQLGRTLALAGEHEHALAAFDRALGQCPDGAPWQPPLVEGAAGSLRALERSGQALELLEGLARTIPERADTLFLAALCRMDLGRFAEAEAGFRRCLELGPARSGPVESSPSAATWAPAHNLGVMCECLGRPAEARAWYERALGFDPGHDPSRAGLARLEAVA